MTDLDPRTRLKLIAKAHRYCGDIVTREMLQLRFRHETGQEPETRDLDLVLRAFAKEVEK